MEIFFVRHGQTDANVAHRHQLDKTLLTPEGRQQAEVIAVEIKKLKPTNLVSSSLVRAVETASVIGEVCNLIPETSADFIELEGPSWMYGHYHSSFRSLLFYAAWYFGFKSDGESYREIRERFRLAQAFFAKYSNDARVVVVSHAAFMHLFTAHICKDSSMSIRETINFFLSVIRMPNTKIIHFNYEKEAPANTCAWTVLSQLES